MADVTPVPAALDISTIKTDAEKLAALWATANTQYEARKAALAARVDAYVAAHQAQADLHTAEIMAASAVKATIVPVVAAAETGLSDVEQFVFTSTWFTKVKTWVAANKRPLLYGAGVSVLGLVYHFA